MTGPRDSPEERIYTVATLSSGAKIIVIVSAVE
jgi:hypothetical protein